MSSIDHYMHTLPPLTPINSDFDKATEDDLRGIENLTNARLPEAVSEFLRRYGGAMFSGEATVTGKDGPPTSDQRVMTPVNRSRI